MRSTVEKLGVREMLGKCLFALVSTHHYLQHRSAECQTGSAAASAPWFVSAGCWALGAAGGCSCCGRVVLMKLAIGLWMAAAAVKSMRGGVWCVCGGRGGAMQLGERSQPQRDRTLRHIFAGPLAHRMLPDSVRYSLAPNR